MNWEWATRITVAGIALLPILFGILGFFLMVLLSAWIIRIGIQWGISKSDEELRAIVREAILSTQDSKELVNSIPKDDRKEAEELRSDRS